MYMSAGVLLNIGGGAGETKMAVAAAWRSLVGVGRAGRNSGSRRRQVCGKHHRPVQFVIHIEKCARAFFAPRIVDSASRVYVRAVGVADAAHLFTRRNLVEPPLIQEVNLLVSTNTLSNVQIYHDALKW
jgi:hypothetical protein